MGMAARLLGVGLRLRIQNWLPSLEGLLTPRRMLGGFVLLAVLFSSLPISHALRPNGHPKDYPLWYETGQKVIRGEQLYPPGEVFPFMYPPIAAVLLAPLSALGPVAMVAALTAINSAVWLGCAFLSAYLLTGKPFGRHPLLYLVPVCCSAPFAFDTYHLGQVNLLLLFVMLGAFACLRAGREWGAGALVALAVGIKAFPLMAAGYLVYRRHWVACASLVVTLGALFVAVPFAVRGPKQGAEDLKVWAGGMLFKYDNGSIGQRTGRAYSWKNQSLVGMANRLLQHKSADEDTTRNFYVNVADLDFRTTSAIIVGVALAICLFYIGVMPRHADRTPESNAIEFGMLLLMVLLFSPYSFGYFFVWLLYPFAVLAHLWLKQPAGSPDKVRLATVFAVCVALPALSLVHQRTAEAYGNFYLKTLILLGTLGWQLNKLKHAARAA
jgi:hypothetical protein